MRDAGMAYIESFDSLDKSERFTLAKDWSTTFIYESDSEDGLLGSLYKIKQFEREISEFEGWKDYCWAKGVDDPSCRDDFVISSLKGFEGLNIDASTAATAKANL